MGFVIAFVSDSIVLSASSYSLFKIISQGENARLSSLIGAMAISDLVKTTLGPKGYVANDLMQCISSQSIVVVE